VPYVVPGTVLGIGYIVAFNRKPLLLAGTATLIVMTYFVRRLPYSVRSAASILKQLDPALEEAGINHAAATGSAHSGFRNNFLPGPTNVPADRVS